MEKLADEFIDGFYDYIWRFGKTAQFLKNQKIIAAVIVGLAIAYWLVGAKKRTTIE